MTRINLKKYFIYFTIIFFIFLADRFSKIYILKIAEDTEYLNIYINNFLNIILIWNKGIGFGLLSIGDSTIYNLISLLILFINVIIFFLILKSDNLRSLFYSLILGGSLGNLFDRFYYTAVPDFIDLNYNGYHWFIFNIADIFITLGIICLIFAEFIDYKRVKNEKKA